VHNEPDKNLEALIHAELRQLPELPAPRNLVGRVMTMIAEQERQPWWRRPWLTWPKTAQAASAALLLAFIGGAGFIGHTAWEGLSLASVENRSWMSLEGGWEFLGTLGNAVLVVLRAVNPVWLMGGLAFAGFVYLTCIGLGTVCFRVAFQPSLRR